MKAITMSALLYLQEQLNSALETRGSTACFLVNQGLGVQRGRYDHYIIEQWEYQPDKPLASRRTFRAHLTATKVYDIYALMLYALNQLPKGE